MNILLTGSSGLIGTALVDRLSTSHHAVTRLVRGAPAPGPGPGTVAVGWDPVRGTIDVAGLDRAGPFDGVVHLAGAGIGAKRWSAERKAAVVDSRIESTRLLVDTLDRLSARPPVLVSASAIGWYGDRGDEVLTEASAPGTGFLAELCRGWEAAAEPAGRLGMRTVLLRTGIVMSGTGGALGRQLPLFRLGLGGRMGGGKQYRSWISLEDEIGVILHCLKDDGLRGPVNATAPEPATDAELARSLGAVLHRPSVVAVPAAALRLALGREMAEELVLGGQRVLPAALQSVGYEFAHAHLDDAVRAALRPVV
ncbi:MAG TPA: TIGR01777 family oxidoreductase [Nakamurella sp.]